MPDQPHSAASPSQRPATVDALLNLGDAAFVRAAYWTLLGREVDDEGLATYTALVRGGAEKQRLVVALATSDEGRQRRQKLDGLEALVAKLGAPPASPLRRAWYWLSGQQHHHAAEATARALRAIDNRLHLIEAALQENATRTEEMRAAVAQLAGDVQSLRSQGPRTDDMGQAGAEATGPRRQVPPMVQRLVAGMLRMRERRVHPTA